MFVQGVVLIIEIVPTILYINKKQEESYLGDVELSVMSNYAWELMSILEFAKYNGIGQKNKLGYGQILLKY